MAKNNAGKRFFNFSNFSTIFFGIFLPWSSINGIRDENFFLSFSPYLFPFWLKIMPERGFFFLIFEFFCYFFQNFLPRVVYEWNSGLNFFFLLFGLSHPVLAKNNAGKRFFNFLNFFAIFLGIFLPWSSMNGIRD